MVQWTSDPASKCVSDQWQTELPSLCMQSNNVAVRIYKGKEMTFLMPLLYSQIKIATKTEVMFCNSCHKEIKLHWLLQFEDDFHIFLENGPWAQRKWTASGITSTCTRSSKVDQSPQYSTKSLRLRKFLCSWLQLK